MFIHTAQRPELSFGLQTKYINRKRIYIGPDGNSYPSITTVLSELSKTSIQKWRERVGEAEANKISGQASRRGTRVHSVCERYIKNQEEPFRGEYPNIIELFKSIEPMLQRVNNVQGVELGLYSKHFGLAGRTDLIAEFDGTLSVIDYKTSNRTKKKEWCESYFAQGSFYAIAYEELTGIPVSQVVIMVAVDNDQPQLFVEKRNNWVDTIWKAKKLYELNNNVKEFV